MLVHSYRVRRWFTLIELVIVIALLTLAGGVIGVKTVGALQEQRFRSEVYLVVERLRLAQELMLIMNCDVTLKFKQLPHNKGIEVQLLTDQKLPPSWHALVGTAPLKLGYINLVEYDGPHLLPNGPGELNLAFYSKGIVMSRGIVRLATGERFIDNVLERYVPLKGYPHPIVVELASEDFALLHAEPLSDVDEERLTQATYETIHRLQQK